MYWFPSMKGWNRIKNAFPIGSAIQFYLCAFNTLLSCLLRNELPLRNGSLSVYEYTYSRTPLIIQVNFVLQSILHGHSRMLQHNGSTASEKPHCNSGSINSDQCALDNSTTSHFLMHQAHLLQ